MEGLADPNLYHQLNYNLSQTWNNKPLYLQNWVFFQSL